ncbi:MAG: APC family permease [Gammaproteobacteria bacterium]
MDISFLLNKILGKPLATKQKSKERLNIITGVPALGLDSLASTAYGPEAALMILLPLGLIGLKYFLPISIAIVAVLFILYFSYMQTIKAYPNGGGAYIVASDNLGKRFGICAAVALLLDYLLNVAVGISAGVGAIVSAIPELQHYTLIICLAILLMLTFINLRGVREPGFVFLIPVLIFVACMSITIILGIFYIWRSHGQPPSVVSPPSMPTATNTLSLWLLLSAFANGLTAMTGIEAISNAVPLFKKPRVRNARITLTLIAIILGLFLLGLGYLCPMYHIIAMDELQPGYRTILAQLIAAITGKGIFFYLSIISIFIILTYSAQTSFVGFPRVCRLLAEDSYLPHYFSERGRRLVFSYGIVILAIFSAVLLVAFNGITLKLIPLFAIGAFSAFLFSQTGMIFYWLRKKEPGTRIKLFFNAAGAVTTLISLIIIIAVKFVEGAWIILLVAPILVFILIRINLHYKKITKELKTPIKLQTSTLQPPIVIIPINGWDRISERALQFGLLLSEDIYCINISTESDDKEHWLRKIWTQKIEKPAKETKMVAPKLEIIKSPYRRVNKPILDFVKKIRKKHANRLITVVIPELVEPHWYEYLLHTLRAASLRAALFMERNHNTVVISIPWYLHEDNSKK